MPLDIRAAILCDLVRTENTGKQILVGVYTGNVVFSKNPARFSPWFWIDLVFPTQNSEFEVEFKIEAPDLEKPHTAVSKGHIEKQKNLIIAFSSPPLEIKQPGLLKFSMRAKKGGRWQKVIEKRLEFAPAS